jgi:hypothetical protein
MSGGQRRQVSDLPTVPTSDNVCYVVLCLLNSPSLARILSEPSAVRPRAT